MSDNTLEGRRSYSVGRLAKFSAEVARLESYRTTEGISIYSTGSFGRLEASEHSDLDVFFITEGEPPSRLAKTLLDADIIRLMERFGFPEPSGDGEYLTVHSLEEMQQHLGGPSDDYANFFTARMLLLLESRPIAGEQVYNDAMEEIVQWYFRDYDDHADQFRPVFLTNDIIRFWKTLCLNYENKRNLPVGDDARAKHRLKNLKLKFSRMTTCFSTLIAIGARPTVSPDDLAGLVKLTPWERLEGVADRADRRSVLDDLRSKYEWFIGYSAQPPAEQRAALLDTGTRREAFGKADEFGARMYQLLQLCTTDETRRYLIV